MTEDTEDKDNNSVTAPDLSSMSVAELEQRINELRAMAADLEEDLGDPMDDADIPVDALRTHAQIIDLHERRRTRAVRAYELERAPRMPNPALSFDQAIALDQTVCELSALLRERDQDSPRIKDLFDHYRLVQQERQTLRAFVRDVLATLPERCAMAREIAELQELTGELSERAHDAEAERDQLKRAKGSDRPDQERRHHIIGACLVAISRLHAGGWRFATSSGPQPSRVITAGRIVESEEVRAVNRLYNLAPDTLLSHAKTASGLFQSKMANQ